MRVSEAVTLYLQSVEGEMSAHTMKSLRQVLNRLPDCDLDELDEDTLRAWRQSELERGVSHASANTYMKRASMFLGYCYKRRWTDGNVAELLNRLDTPSRRRLQLSSEQITTMIRDARHPRDRAMIACASEWLMRAGELAAIRVGDVHMDVGYVDVMIEKKKGELALDEVPITAGLRAEIRWWLGIYRNAAGPLSPDAFLFPRLSVRRVGPSAVTRVHPSLRVTHPEKVIGLALQRIGVETERAGFHDIRRSMARLRYEALCDGGHADPLGVIQALLHHVDRRTTELYIGTEASRTVRNQAMRSTTWLSVLPSATPDERISSDLAPVIPLRP